MSITHLEDLTINELYSFLSHPTSYTATEKIDGSQLLFGIDQKGFYTSRETKGGVRVYNVADYKPTFKNTYIRAAHMALEQSLPSLKSAGLERGAQIEVEVLHGEFPNAVQYSIDKNFIIFLKSVSGYTNVDQLVAKLRDQPISVSLTVPFTPNGKDIGQHTINELWYIDSVPEVQLDNTLLDDISEHHDYISGLISEQYNECMTYEDLLVINLNHKPYWITDDQNWSSIRAQLTIDRDDIRFRVKRITLSLKEILLDKIVRRTSSKFGPPGGWIEGVVFSNGYRYFKIVDKDVFLRIKDFYWEKRNELFKMSKSGCNKDDIQKRLDKYEQEKDSLKLQVNTKVCQVYGSVPKIDTFEYGKTIDRRTKEIFADLYQQA